MTLPPSRKRRRGEVQAEAADHSKAKYVAHLVVIMRQAGDGCSFAAEWRSCSTAADTQAWEEAFTGMICGKFEVGSIRGA